MISSRKEQIFLLTIGVLSFLCSFYSGFRSLNLTTANPLELKIENAEDIVSSISSGGNSPDYVFKGGYCYTLADGELHSDFYQGSISFIPTSDNWRIPINEFDASLSLKKEKEGLVSELLIHHELTLPTISVVCNPEDFFSYEKGIYVKGRESDFQSADIFYPFPWNRPSNYYRSTDDEKEVFFSYHDVEGHTLYHAYVKAEINGKATRSFPQKSIRLSRSRKTGSELLEHDFFGDGLAYKSILLRNGGNDNFKTLFRDMLMQALMAGTGVLTSGFVPCDVYINGQYWGIHFLQNKSDADFISVREGVKSNKITMVESWKLEKGKETEYNTLMSMMHGLGNDPEYENMASMIDMDNLASYIAGEIFFANTDWPKNNLKMYKVTDKQKTGKWKFVFFDLDYGFGYTGREASRVDMFGFLYGKKDLFSNLFKELMKHDEFKKLLKLKLEILMKDNFSAKRMKVEIGKLRDKLRGSMQKHTERWRRPSDVEEWEAEVDLLDEFASERGAVMKKQILKYLD